ncbi:efflux RND transporter periplasmic adaptor subunit [Campylobacter sp. MG1]|uniref:efflux RND transporter periplasmic adaptor subunit n=1 Tax=Campylobacter sp. MG1 TaxID=2976332 RepID=UPI00226CA924|nr:efflux RND transporter periplasmic adaptor subunit [Campylobacter sp. MG1]
MKKILFILFAINLYSDSIYASFDVVAQKSAKLALPSVGIVDNIYVSVGDSVKKDDILLNLDYAIEQVGLDSSMVDLDLANTALKFANNTLSRYKQVESVINKQNLDEISFKKDEASNKLRAAKINISKYKTLISQKQLKAPFDGVITAKFIEVGEGVGGVAQPLFILDSYPDVKLLLSFDEKYVNLVKVGDTYEYMLDGLKISGKISKIYPNIDMKTRKVYAEVLAKDIKIGSFGEGYIITDK